MQVDLDSDLTRPEQTRRFTLPACSAAACVNGAHGAFGKYGGMSSTVFVDSSTQPKHTSGVVVSDGNERPKAPGAEMTAPTST
jgi:hypothetical protein